MFKYIKKYLKYAILAPLFMFGEVFMDLCQPRLMGSIVDDGVLGINNGGVGDMNIVFSVGLRMILYVLIGGFCGVMSGVFANLCSQNFGNDVRKAAFGRIMSFSFEQTDKFSSGSLITRVTNDITQLQNFVGQIIRGFVRTFLLFAGGIICMLSLNLSFGVVIACSLPLVVICVIYFISKANPMFGKLQKKLDNVNNVMSENVSGARVVKAFVREEYEKDRFGKANQELVGTQLDVLVLFSYMTPLMNIVLNMSIVAIIKVGGIQVEAGMAAPGMVMAAITYTSQVLNAVMRMSMIFQTVSRGVASGKRINEILVCEPAIADGSGELDKEAYKNVYKTNRRGGTVEFRNVTFAYPGASDKLVLDGINLTIESGETVAIMGATGCGKSSLVNLIPRFYDVTSGEVLVDGINVKDYKLEVLRNKIAMTLQNSEIFSTSIKDNILWGKPCATDDEVNAAADIAQASEFIEAQPEGMETQVAEGGNSLSGGQKQRLSISRAVLKAAPILILDDSTSALDLKTEAKLYEALNGRVDGKETRIIIAQRIASVKNADRIVILDNGKIAACGTHEELLKNSDIYKDIYDSQLKRGGAADEQ